MRQIQGRSCTRFCPRRPWSRRCSQGRRQCRRHLLFHAHKAGGAFFRTQAGGVLHHHGGAAHQHHVVIGGVVQLGDKAVEAHRTGVGGYFYEVCDAAVLLHAVGGVAETEEHVRLYPGSGQLAGELEHGRGADAAAHHGDLFVLAHNVRHIKAVAHGAGKLEGILLLELCQLFGALAHHLIQKLDGAAVRVPAVHADGTGQEGGFVCAPRAQGEELACVGGVVAVRPYHGQQADVRGNDLIAQDGGFTAGCTHEQWPPSCSHTHCKRPRQRQRPAAFCKPAGCRGWS